MTKLSPEIVHFSFQPVAGGLHRDSQVDLSISRNPDETEPATPDSILLMGLGNERVSVLAAKRLAKIGNAGIVAVDGLPYWDSEPTGAGFDRMVAAATEAIHEHLTEQHAVGGPLAIIGESQGMYGTLLAANEQPELWDDAALLRPVGFQGDISKLEFASRMIATGFQPSVAFDRATMPIAAHAGYRAMQDQIRTGGKALSFALDFDAYRRLDTLVEANQGTDRRVGVFAAEQDLVFSPQKIQRGLGRHANLLQTIGGPHASPATKVGARQVTEVHNWLNTTA